MVDDEEATQKTCVVAMGHVCEGSIERTTGTLFVRVAVSPVHSSWSFPASELPLSTHFVEDLHPADVKELVI